MIKYHHQEVHMGKSRFKFFKKEKPSQPNRLRDTLFGDMPISEWGKQVDLKTEPWTSFVQVREYLDAKNEALAIETLQRITDMQNLESRHYLQAWHFLRQLGVNPPDDKAKIVYGVVVEVGMEKGTDILAAYADYTARYYNFSGAAVIWERGVHSLDAEIEALIEAGQALVGHIGPWDQARPDEPPADYVRLNILTPSGLHFGYGSFNAVEKDPMAKIIFHLAAKLMQSLTQWVQRQS
jgi:hypothetical protein